ncbi:MAG: ABC-2 family transporter protein [Chloroflexota bacterium]
MRDYGFQDVVMVWAIAAFSVGIASAVFGNAWRYGILFAQGALDFFLVLPKPVLLHVIVSRMSVTAWGDVLFGAVLYLGLVRPSPGTFALFLLLSVAATAIFISYGVAVNALAFWLGNAEGLARECLSALLIFSTYPSTLFTGAVKVLLFTAVPAGFVAYVPVELLHEWSWPRAAALVVAAVLAVVASTTVFYAGLGRYESGNLLAMRA